MCKFDLFYIYPFFPFFADTSFHQVDMIIVCSYDTFSYNKDALKLLKKFGTYLVHHN